MRMLRCEKVDGKRRNGKTQLWMVIFNACIHSPSQVFSSSSSTTRHHSRHHRPPTKMQMKFVKNANSVLTPNRPLLFQVIASLHSTQKRSVRKKRNKKEVEKMCVTVITIMRLFFSGCGGADDGALFFVSAFAFRVVSFENFMHKIIISVHHV